MYFQRLKETSMLPAVGTTPRWTSGRPNLTLRRGAPQRAVVSACTTTSAAATTLPQRAHSYRRRYFDFTSTTRPDESFTKCAPHSRQMNRGTRLLMRTTTQPTERSATSSVWIHKKVTGERPGGLVRTGCSQEACGRRKGLGG